LHVVDFKHEDLHTAALIFEVNEFLFKFDLKSGYHHVDIYPEQYKHLGFLWETKHITTYIPTVLCFTVLSFGHSMAYYLFGKLMRPLIKHWQSRGLRTSVYLDDRIVEGEQETKRKVLGLSMTQKVLVLSKTEKSKCILSG